MEPPEKLVHYTEFHANQDLAYLSLGMRGVAIVLGLLAALLLIVAAVLPFAVGHVAFTSGDPEPPSGIGISLILASCLSIVGVASVVLSVASWFTGGYMKVRRRHRFCRTTAAALCLFVPIGTYYGGLSYLTLGRKEVRRQFTS